MALPSSRELEFVGLTIQDEAQFKLDSLYNDTSDSWNITVESIIFFQMQVRGMVTKNDV